VFFKWPFVGMCVETFGFLNLFGCGRLPITHTVLVAHVAHGDRDFFPVILTFLRQLPVIGNFLSLPYIGPVRRPYRFPSISDSLIIVP